jgi:hypothetical protein
MSSQHERYESEQNYTSTNSSKTLKQCDNTCPNGHAQTI